LDYKANTNNKRAATTSQLLGGGTEPKILQACFSSLSPLGGVAERWKKIADCNNIFPKE